MPVARPVSGAIDYATPSTPDAAAFADPNPADVPFEPIPAVEALIDARAEFAVIRRHFWFTRGAQRYVARTLARRYTAGTAGDCCSGCDAVTRGVISVRWHVKDGRAVEPFVTTHACCDACAAKIRATVLRARGLAKPCLVLLSLAFACVAGVRLAPPRFTPIFGLSIAALAIATFVVILIDGEWITRSLPARIRGVIPSWIDFAAWGPAATRRDRNPSPP